MIQLLLLATLTLALPAQAIETPRAQAANQTTEYRIGDRLAPPARARGRAAEITWDDLLPPGWDPGKALEGLNLDQLSDNDPRAMEALEKLRTMWNNAPANPAVTGKPIRIPGFMVPLEYGKKDVKEFLLVPYFGACIHVPPPPANQIIHVTSVRPVRMNTYMDAVWIEGALELGLTKTEMGDSGYRMRAARVEPYVEKKKK